MQEEEVILSGEIFDFKPIPIKTIHFHQIYKDVTNKQTAKEKFLNELIEQAKKKNLTVLKWNGEILGAVSCCLTSDGSYFVGGYLKVVNLQGTFLEGREFLDGKRDFKELT